VTHGARLALRNVAPTQSGKPGVGLELPEPHGTKQDETGRDEEGHDSGVRGNRKQQCVLEERRTPFR